MLAQEEHKAEVIQALKGALPQDRQRHVLKLLATLFPTKAKDFEGPNAFGAENRAHVGARRGVGSELGYDAYFRFYLSPEAIPKTIIDEIIRKRDDRVAIVGLIEPYIEKKDKFGRAMAGDLLEELRFRFYGQERTNPTPELLQALFDVGERVLRVDSTPEAFSPSPQEHLSYLVSEMLEIWGPQQAGPYLISAFSNSESAAFCATIFADRARELNKLSHNSSSSPKIEEAHLSALGKRVIALIDTSSANGSLRDAPAYWDIVESWKYLRNESEPRAWLSAGMIDSAKFLATATMALVAYSISSRERSYSVRSRPDETLFDLEVLYSSCQRHLAGTELNADQQKRVTVVQDAVARILAEHKNKRRRRKTERIGRKLDKAADLSARRFAEISRGLPGQARQ